MVGIILGIIVLIILILIFRKRANNKRRRAEAKGVRGCKVCKGSGWILDKSYGAYAEYMEEHGKTPCPQCNP